MAPTSRSHYGTILVLTFVFILSAPRPLAGQRESRLFPSRAYLTRVIAAPHAPVTGAKLVVNSDGPSEFGNAVEGEVALGASLPLYLISGSNLQDGLVVGVEGAVFARFTLTTITRDLIATDWIFAIPFTLHLGDNWLRFRYHHTSAHMGDEYIARFAAQIEDYSRDAADFTAFYQATASFGLYGGGNWAFNIHPDGSRRMSLRVGAQAEARNSNRPFLPYGAVDVQWEQDDSWEPRLNVQVGIQLPEVGGRRSVRLAMEFLAGPSSQGQFHEEHVRHLTLGLYIDP